MSYPETREPIWPYRGADLAKPMHWQAPALKAMLRRDRLVLCAPTGAGKTAVALAPVLMQAGGAFVDRCIYALPMRSLARSLYEEYADEVRRLGLTATLQMGGDNADPDFRGHIIFTTIDQLLSRYLMVPYGGRPANIGGGALVGAHIVLDEFHLYPSGEARLTALAMLQHLRDVSSFVVMTATLPHRALQNLSELLDADALTVTVGDMERSGDRKRPRRAWLWKEEPLSATAAIEAWEQAGRPDRVLVCVNTVARAQSFLADLSARLDPDAQALLVHSRFLPSDRNQKEALAIRWLGKNPAGGTRWVVATQVIEAGMNLSADLLLTDLAPASALVQRAGRCARWPRSDPMGPPQGTVIVYGNPEQPGHLPYEAQDIVATWQCRQDVAADQGADYEAQLVEGALGDREDQQMEQLRGRLEERRRQCLLAIDRPDPANRWQLVRNASSQAVLVCAAPDRVVVDDMPETVSVPESSLRGLFARVAPTSARIPVCGHAPREATVWNVPDDVRAALASPLLVLTPDVASYDPCLGLVLGQPGAETPIRYRGGAAEEQRRYRYRQQPFEDHIKACLAAGDTFLGGAEAATRRLSCVLDVSPDALRAAARLAIALHDVGKLTKAWQDWATRWQSQAHGRHVDCCLSHTDFDPNDPAQTALHRNMGGGPPPHAVEGALLVRPIIEQWAADNLGDGLVQPLYRALLGAVARHHSARASSAKPQWAHPAAKAAVESALRMSGHDPGMASLLETRIGIVDAELSDADLPSAWGHQQGQVEVLLYWYIARLTRLADQHSFDPIPLEAAA